MKKLIFSVAIILSLGLASCGEVEKPIPENETLEYPKPTGDQKIEYPTLKENGTEQSETKVEKNKPNENQQSTNIVDTSFFKFAKSVDVIDNRSTQNNLLVWIDYSADSEPGISTLNTLNQAFYFLQQSDVVNTGTVTLAIRVDDVKVAQFNVTPSNVDFNNTQLGMADIVVNGSEIEYLNEGVKAFGQVMEMWD
ncbi:hypothetical protein [Lysinibacillus fusiformis]|uniref:hypothetical protein n=1 Tax=Lysinibacillus fusiformis TaxID=28031 RepID=UPI00148D6CB7|nr:hypothetical protein [Lysinibacillus fusiformis]NOG29061.1 hypothetical protein [Lysinibacillus fusiformis]